MAEPNELQVETPRKFVPHYAIDPIADCYESAVKLSHLLHLSMNGLGMVSRRPLLLAQLMDATRACGDEITPELKKDHSHATADAKFAQA
ncbi:MAG TPA: hypothetical protein VJS43_08825, partial [Candidatus Acidoferrales bacterium]|nr:hypothetical protein [Candidatus Acidoferrales bacterium]